MFQPQYTDNICLDVVGALDSKPGLSLRHEAFSQEWRFYTLENQNVVAFSKVDDIESLGDSRSKEESASMESEETKNIKRSKRNY